MKSLSKQIGILYTIGATLLFSCNHPSQTNDYKTEPLPQKTVEINPEKDTSVKYKEIVAEAKINNAKWKPATGNVTVTLTQDHKKYYAIMLTDGVNNVILTYSGKETTGKVNTGDLFHASVLDVTGNPYICSDGYIQFTRFDTIEKKMSAHFKLNCVREGSTPMNIQDASFSDLTW